MNTENSDQKSANTSYLQKTSNLSKNAFQKIFTGPKAKRNILVISVLVLAIFFASYKLFANKAVTTYEYVRPEIKTIQKTVEGSGKVVSVSELDIQQLQNGGKITGVFVKPGDYVKSGQIIATLDNRSASIQLTQAKASYDKIVNGSTKEDLDISKQSLQNSKNSLDQTKKAQDLNVANAYRNLLNSGPALRSVYDDKVYSDLPTLSGSYICSQENEYKISMNSSSYVSVSSQNGSSQILITSVPQKLDDCGLYISFDSTKNWLFGEWVIQIPNKQSSTYASNLASYNSALQTREQTILNAEASITNNELTLNQKVVGARPEDIASAKASLASAQLNYENTIIRAPFAGQIGAVSAAVGQQTNSQAGVATIITKDKIAEISLNEIDIVNVKLGQEVELVFDAIPDEVFKGSVAEINTVGVETSNVVSFAVKISIPNADERIKSGMSVTANVITEKKENILALPSSTIKTEKIKTGQSETEKSYVNKKENPNEKTYISVGITNDIDTEVLEGITETTEVVSKVNSGTTAAKTQATFSLFGGGRPTGAGATTRTTTR